MTAKEPMTLTNWFGNPTDLHDAEIALLKDRVLNPDNSWVQILDGDGHRLTFRQDIAKEGHTVILHAKTVGGLVDLVTINGKEVTGSTRAVIVVPHQGNGGSLLMWADKPIQVDTATGHPRMKVESGQIVVLFKKGVDHRHELLAGLFDA